MTYYQTRKRLIWLLEGQLKCNQKLLIALRKKCSYSELFLSASSRIRTEYLFVYNTSGGCFCSSQWSIREEAPLYTFFFYKQPTILIEPQRCLVFCDFQGNLLLSCCLIFIKKIWTLKLQEE